MLLQFAYYAQCRCDPSQTPRYFGALVKIVQWLNSVMIVPQDLESLIVTERSRGRFNEEDVQKAIWVLGFGSDNSLKVDYDEDVDDNFLRHAWKDAVRRSWNEPDASSRRRDLNEAIRVVAEWKRSTELMKAWDTEVTNAMTPDKAYDTLEVPLSVDEEMLIAVYTMRVSSLSLICKCLILTRILRSKSSLRNWKRCAVLCAALLISLEVRGWRSFSRPAWTVSSFT